MRAGHRPGGRRPGVPISAVLGLAALCRADMRHHPFRWGVARDVFGSSEAARELARTFPDQDYWFFDTRDIRWEAHPLVVLGSDLRPRLSSLPASWEELVDDLLAPPYRDTLGELIGCSLEGGVDGSGAAAL